MELKTFVTVKAISGWERRCGQEEVIEVSLFGSRLGYMVTEDLHL